MSHSLKYDKHMEHQDQTTLGKLQKQYWYTKQQVLKKLGKKEDEFVVASDADLDSKLELFAAVKQNSNELLRVIDHYQEKLVQLSIEESEMSNFLKETAQHDKTRAGKMMSAVGKAQKFSAQQRMTLRVPLTRLFNEVETFRYQAVTDTWLTIRKMEAARTEYRGALLWMKDVSEELDPDMNKKLEKFRRVQAQVKTTKTYFDRYKNDVIEKIELLAASRCNMFSHVLVHYQQSLIQFWAKTAKAMNAVAEAFKGYQYYEFNISKDLNEPSRRVMEISNRLQSHDDGGECDDEKNNEENGQVNSDVNRDIDSLLDFFSAPVASDNDSNLINLDENNGKNEDNDLIGDDVNDLIDIMASKEEMNIKEQLKELEMLEKIKNSKHSASHEANKTPNSLSLNNFMSGSEIDDYKSNADEENSFNSIITKSNDEFEREWQSAFHSPNTPTKSNAEPSKSEDLLQLETEASLINLDLNESPNSAPKPNLSSLPFYNYLFNNNAKQTTAQQQPTSQKQAQQKSTDTSKSNKKDLASWYNLFAELDPLQNPDAIGSKDEHEEQRNC